MQCRGTALERRIRIRGARTHNLKNIDLDLPRDRLIVITGLSGSGKSSLAFDTIYAEGQRRYVESLSAYARQFLSMMEKPDVDHIEGLSPAISIEQKIDLAQPALHRRHHHRDLRLPAPAVRPRRQPRCPDHGETLPRRPSARWSTRCWRCRKARADAAGPGGARAQGRARAGVRAAAPRASCARGRRARVELDDATEAGSARKHTSRWWSTAFACAPTSSSASPNPSRPRCARPTAGVASPMDDEPARAELLFSALRLPALRLQHAAELEPRLFSFNNPAGRLPELRRPRRAAVLRRRTRRAHPELSLAGGRDPRLGPAQRLLFPDDPVAGEALRLRCRAPLANCRPESARSCSTAAATTEIKFATPNERGDDRQAQAPFEGILPTWSAATARPTSALVREELAKYLGTRAARTCEGTRLNASPRATCSSRPSLPHVTRCRWARPGSSTR
jgi:excinuclease ABC subunit A